MPGQGGSSHVARQSAGRDQTRQHCPGCPGPFPGQVWPLLATDRRTAQPHGLAARASPTASPMGTTPQGAASTPQPPVPVLPAGRLPSAMGCLWRSLALHFIVGNHENTAIVTEPRRNYSSSDGSWHGTPGMGPPGGWQPCVAPGLVGSRPRGPSPRWLRVVWH